MKGIMLSAIPLLGFGLSPCEAAIGETQAQCNKRYGKGKLCKLEGGGALPGAVNLVYELGDRVICAVFANGDPSTKCTSLRIMPKRSLGAEKPVKLPPSVIKEAFMASGGGRKWKRQSDNVIHDPEKAPDEFFTAEKGLESWITADKEIFAMLDHISSDGILDISSLKGPEPAEAALVESCRVLLKQAADPNIPEISIDRGQLTGLLRAMATLLVRSECESAMKCLAMAQSKDGTHIDKEILEFVTNTPVPEEVVTMLIQVLGNRANPDIFASLLAQAPKWPARPSFSAFNALGEFVERLEPRERFLPVILAAYEEQSDEAMRNTMLLLLARTGSEKARGLITHALKGNDPKAKSAAIHAMAFWPDHSMLEPLIQIVSQEEDSRKRLTAHYSITKILCRDGTRGTAKAQAVWAQLAGHARSEPEQMGIIEALRAEEGDWAVELIESVASQSSSQRVKQRARFLREKRSR